MTTEGGSRSTSPRSRGLPRSCRGAGRGAALTEAVLAAARSGPVAAAGPGRPRVSLGSLLMQRRGAPHRGGGWRPRDGNASSSAALRRRHGPRPQMWGEGRGSAFGPSPSETHPGICQGDKSSREILGQEWGQRGEEGRGVPQALRLLKCVCGGGEDGCPAQTFSLLSGSEAKPKSAPVGDRDW